MLLYYIRHCDPIYDPDSLTPLGQRQAEAVGKRLAHYGVDKIYASTSNRAILTAKPACEMLKKEAVLLDFANEKYAFQDFSVKSEGKRAWACSEMNYRRIFASPSVWMLGDRWYEHPDLAEHGEQFKAGLERISRESDNFLLSLGYARMPETGFYRTVAPNDERVAFFAHQGFGIVFISYLLNIPYPLFSTHFDISHSGITVIEFPDLADGTCIPRVLTHSCTGHLYHEGLPLTYNNSVRF